jgi:drug/metabolite transporter (DMT)-like permease
VPATPTKLLRRPSSFLLGLGICTMLLMWTFNYILGKIALDHIDPLSLAVFRFETAAVAMLALYFFAGGERTRIQRGDFGRIVLLAFFGVIVNQGGFTVGLNFTSSDHSAVIAAMAPVMVLLMACALRLEKLTWGKALGMAISFTGVIALETERSAGGAHSPFLKGDVITLVSTVGYASYAVYAKKVSKRYDAISMNTYLLASAALILLPLAIHQAVTVNLRAIGWVGWSGVLYMAIFSSVFAYTIFYWALRYMEASRVAVVSYFQPIAVILFAVPILGDLPTRHLLAGAALVLLGVYLAERTGKRGSQAKSGAPESQAEAR